MNLSSDVTEPPRKHPPLKVIAIAAAVLIGLGALSAINSGDDNDDSDGGVKMTLTQAACKLLHHDHEDPETAYAVLKDLAADHPLVYGEDESIAARAALEQGCG